MTELENAAARIASLLVARRQTVALAESSAGGLISAALLTVPGASAFFLGGAVVYTAAAREALLGLGTDRMRGLRSASEPYAQLLAATIRGRLGTVWGLAETGAAGPTGNRYGDAAGHACLAIAGPAELVRTLETGSSDRAANMAAFSVAALALFEEALKRPGAKVDPSPAPR